MPPITNIDQLPRFHWLDYCILVGMLLSSTLIGIYYGCFGTKQKSAEEFLLGNRNLGVFPVSMSLLASFLSAIALLGNPAEVYMNGLSLSLTALSFIFVVPIVCFLYLPVFYSLRLTSVFEYLELRFDTCVRVFAVILYTINMIIYMAIVLYVPSLALQAVTGMPSWFSLLACGGICTLYTTIGGLKAVVWTDTLQILLMLIGTGTTLFFGVSAAGGLTHVVSTAAKSGRLYDDMFNFSPDPLLRHTFWTVLIGGIMQWTCNYGINQGQVQRYCAVSSVRRAQLALIIGLPGFVILVSLTCFQGLVLYAYYEHCDPIASGLVTKKDQIMAVFALEVLQKFPGLMGIFVAGVFSGSLSTVSTGLNAMAAVALTDIVKVVRPEIGSNFDESSIAKLLALGFGVGTVALSFVVDAMGQQVIEMAYFILGVINGPLLALFTLGIVFPFVNARGANAGLAAGVLVSTWFATGAKIYKRMFKSPPRSIDGCLFPEDDMISIMAKLPLSNTTQIELHNANIPAIYQISYMYSGLLGFTTCMAVGLLISLITTSSSKKPVHHSLTYPLFYKIAFFLPACIRRRLKFGVAYPDDDLISFQTVKYSKAKKLSLPKFNV